MYGVYRKIRIIYGHGQPLLKHRHSLSWSTGFVRQKLEKRQHHGSIQLHCIHSHSLCVGVVAAALRLSGQLEMKCKQRFNWPTIWPIKLPEPPRSSVDWDALSWWWIRDSRYGGRRSRAPQLPPSRDAVRAALSSREDNMSLYRKLLLYSRCSSCLHRN